MNYLVTQCDLRTSMHHGQTALDCLISRDYMKTAKLLICHVDVQRNNDGFSPIMLAVHHDLSSLIDVIFQRLPLQEAIDELVLLACHYIITDDVQSRQRAFDFSVRGLNESEPMETGVPHEAYEYRRECKIVDELLAIWDDENALHMHASIVSEGILLQLGDVDAFLISNDRQCNFYRNERLFHRSIQLHMYAHHLAVHDQFDQGLVLQWQEKPFDKFIIALDRA